MENAEQNRSLSLMYEAGNRLSQTLDINQVYITLHELLSQAMDCDELIVSSYEAKEKLIRCEYYHSMTNEVDIASLPALPLAEDGSGAQSHVIVTGKAMIIPNYHIFIRSGGNGKKKSGQTTSFQELEEVENRSAIVVPMKMDNKVVGVVQIFSYRYNAYSEYDFQLAETVTAQMASARNNAILYMRARAELEQRRLLQDSLEKERELLEQRVAERTESLAQALRVRDEFLSNMSHELRTPLASIQGLSELLQYQSGGNPLSAKQKRYLDLIYQNSEHLIHMVNDLLDMAKIATGEMKLHKEWTALDSLCQSCLHYAEGRAIEKNIKVHFSCRSPVGKIYCDPHRSKQLLNNLLNNAVKFTPDSQAIGFEVSLSAEKNYLEFVIWDQGVGISTDEMEHLFEPFAHFQGTDRGPQAGMGVGLSMAKRMAELQGGTVELRSRPDHGTLVVVSLPVDTQAEENGHGSTEMLTPEQTGILRMIKDAMTNKVILIADEDTTATELLSYYLEIFNVKPVIARNVRELRKALANDTVDLFIVDIFLPGFDPARMIKDIRALERYKNLPIIATSPIQRQIDQDLIRSINVNDFLIKPFHFSDLASKIRKYIES